MLSRELVPFNIHFLEKKEKKKKMEKQRNRQKNGTE